MAHSLMMPSWTTNGSNSKPPTPQHDSISPFASRAQHVESNRDIRDDYTDVVKSWSDDPVANMEALEEKRRAALREREREQAARERNRQIMAQKREQEIKNREALGKAEMEKEQRRTEKLMAEAAAREERREASLRAVEEKSKQMAEETRRLAQVEKRREAALRSLEMNRLREEEAQRIKREQILKKRAEMERVRDETERVYQQRKQEELNRKTALVEDMQKKRSDRLAELERRRTNPVLIQQEREFNQLIDIQAALGRLHVKMEQTQARREDVRERLLESRHLTEVLEGEEEQLTLSVSEVETDIKKLEGFQMSLEKLVNTRYDEDECDPAVTKIQALYRGSRDRAECKRREQEREHGRQNQAALLIQKRQRGAQVRNQMRRRQHDGHVASCAVKLQAIFRGCAARTKVVAWRRALALAVIEKERTLLNDKCTRIQCAFRNFLAKRQFRALLLKKIKKVRENDALKPYLSKRGARNAAHRAGPKARVENSSRFVDRKDPSRQTYPSARPAEPAPLQRREVRRIYVDEGRRPAEQAHVQSRFSVMGSLVSQRPSLDPSPPHRDTMASHSPYSKSPRARRHMPAYPTAVMAELEPRKLFNQLEVMDAGWGGGKAGKVAWHDAAPAHVRKSQQVPVGVPLPERALPPHSMLVRI